MEGISSVKEPYFVGPSAVSATLLEALQPRTAPESNAMILDKIINISHLSNARVHDMVSPLCCCAAL